MGIFLWKSPMNIMSYAPYVANIGQSAGYSSSSASYEILKFTDLNIFEIVNFQIPGLLI